ncbi:MAG TPA: methyltransferase domain-containing protein [Candidatus Binataceae bacterium]|jgi:2-polyprenyl-3-methyl-5-hydroxy-6-metoxy-1,4-benzoquinol methylase|nr:methyltransferase domain-containing protein [Candidatus Binataceae bacterium]
MSEAAEHRARLSAGCSQPAIYAAVASALGAVHPGGGTLVDVGCGSGALWQVLRSAFARYVGVDLIGYDGFPSDGELVISNLDDTLPLADEYAEVVASIETIEHLENPRAFMRQLTRVVKPGGLVIVTTPNQLSLLSKMTLVLKNQFNAFQSGSYPAHLTALLEIDLVRIARECGLAEPAIHYTNSGRIPFTPTHWPRWLGGRLFSDNIILIAHKPKTPQL